MNNLEQELHSLRSDLATAKDRIVEFESAIRYIHQRNGHLGDWVDDGAYLKWLDDKCSELLSHSTITSQSEERRWQDISTAPKDGVRFLATKRWSNGEWQYFECRYVVTTAAPRWHNLSANDWDAPTHWMPLPEPPTSHSTKPEGESHE